MSFPGTILFWTTGGKRVGLGHVRRCLTLALEFGRHGIASRFLLDGDPDICQLVEAEHFPASFGDATLSEAEATLGACREHDISAVIVDSYQVTPDFCTSLRTRMPTVAIDDLGDHQLPVDLVVNGSAGAENLSYEAARTSLLGVSYILLRPEFRTVPRRTFRRRVRRVLITVGGSDSHGLTTSLLSWSVKALPSSSFDVVIGPLFEDTASIEACARGARQDIRFHRDPRNIRELMLDADVAVCGGGQTTYELAATATPAVAIRMAANQTLNLNGLSRMGAIRWVGDAGDFDLQDRFAEARTSRDASQSEREALGRTGRRLVDGRGAERVAQAVMQLLVERNERQ